MEKKSILIILGILSLILIPFASAGLLTEIFENSIFNITFVEAGGNNTLFITFPNTAVVSSANFNITPFIHNIIDDSISKTGVNTSPEYELCTCDIIFGVAACDNEETLPTGLINWYSPSTCVGTSANCNQTNNTAIQIGNISNVEDINCTSEYYSNASNEETNVPFEKSPSYFCVNDSGTLKVAEYYISYNGCYWTRQNISYYNWTDWSIISAYPSNITIDIGNDSTFEFQNITEQIEEKQILVDNFTSAFNVYINDICITSNCSIPINFSSDTIGIFQIEEISIEYDALNITPPFIIKTKAQTETFSFNITVFNDENANNLYNFSNNMNTTFFTLFGENLTDFNVTAHSNHTLPIHFNITDATANVTYLGNITTAKQSTNYLFETPITIFAGESFGRLRLFPSSYSASILTGSPLLWALDIHNEGGYKLYNCNISTGTALASKTEFSFDNPAYSVNHFNVSSTLFEIITVRFASSTGFSGSSDINVWCNSALNTTYLNFESIPISLSVSQSAGGGGGGGGTTVIINKTISDFTVQPSRIDTYYISSELSTPKKIQIKTNRDLVSCDSDNELLKCTVEGTSAFVSLSSNKVEATEITAELQIRSVDNEIARVPVTFRLLNIDAIYETKDLDIPQTITSSIFFKYNSEGQVEGIKILPVALISSGILISLFIYARRKRFL